MEIVISISVFNFSSSFALASLVILSVAIRLLMCGINDYVEDA